MAYAACENAFRGEPFQSGSFGAGTGATVGKIRGPAYAMKGGIGAAAWRQGGLLVGAVAAVNCVGDVLEKGRIIAGVRGDDGRTLIGTEGVILEEYQTPRDFFSGAPLEGTNTVLGCIITNAKLDKAGVTILARQGQNGIARAIRPAHSVYDGDTVFALCTGEVSSSLDAAGILAARAVEAAIIDAVKSARSLGGYPALGKMDNPPAT
jgi:L-aminopeptidase/D-esterase-like protein